jgi:zinc-ribbon domain
VRCGRCGNENSETNRFCGMCGAPLIAKAQSVAQPSGQEPAVRPVASIGAPRPVAIPAQRETARTVATEAPGSVRPSGLTAERTSTGFSSADVKAGSEPLITGPSFLGLNKPPDVGHDALRPSSSVDYLLDDDEEEPKRGGGKFILVLVALVLAAGLGYLHWKQGGFAWLTGERNSPVAAPTAEGTPTDAASGSPNNAANAVGATAPGGAGAVTAPATSTVPNPAASVAAQASPSQDGPAHTGASTPPTQNGAPSSPSQTAGSPTGASQPQTTPAQTKASESGPADGAPQAPSDSVQQASPQETPAAPRATLRKPPAAKPSPKPVDAVAEAERLIYGNGVRQDCDRGMRALKSATELSNAQAMISLGVVYSTGTCVPRDLPTSYRWFALALHKEPNDQALQDDLQKVWGQMTQAERQLAIKMSQ